MVEMRKMKRKERQHKAKIKGIARAVIKKMRLSTKKQIIRKKSSLKCKVINQVHITDPNLQNLGKLFKISMLIPIKHSI